MLAGMEQVDDLGGLGELAAGDVPDPGGAVAENRELADVARAAAGAFAFTRSANTAAGSKVAM